MQRRKTAVSINYFMDPRYLLTYGKITFNNITKFFSNTFEFFGNFLLKLTLDPIADLCLPYKRSPCAAVTSAFFSS